MRGRRPVGAAVGTAVVVGTAGVLSDEEFAAAKAKLLGGCSLERA
jgi:hypothetical protein